MVMTMRLSKDGDVSEVRAGVEALFRAEYRSLVRLARLLVDDPGQAEEVVQDAFVALHRNWARADDPLRYVRTCVVNGARGRLRRRATARKHLRSLEAPVDDAPDRVVLAESQQAVAAALETLPPRQRACIALRFYSGLTEAETAATLGISIGSIKTHVHRALATLAVRLEDFR